MAKKGEKTEEVHLRFFTEEDLQNLQAVKKVCKKKNIPVTEFIRDCIHFYLREKCV